MQIDKLAISDVLDRIQVELEANRPLAAIERALEVLAQAADEKTHKCAIRRLCKAALLLNGVPESDNAMELVFHPELGPAVKRFVAVCLLRALAASPGSFLEATLRNRTFLLFDLNLPDIYKQLKLDPKRQTHEKETGLRTYVCDAERKAVEIFQPLEQVDDPRRKSIAHFRSDFHKLLGRFGPLLSPFLDKDLLGPSLEDIFSSVEEYLEMDGAAALHPYERSKTALAAYAAQAARYGTKYSEVLCQKLGVVLTAICDRKFEQSGAGRPARINVRPSEKKYPLTDVNRIANLGFILENTGPGYAREVSCTIALDGSVEVRKPELYLGNLGVAQIAVEFPAKISVACESVFAEVSCRWTNFDSSTGTDSGMFELSGQPPGVDWDSLGHQEHYKLEPITTELELVGRTEILNQLAANACAGGVGSACIWGQRRVGKTSIARTLRTRLLGKDDLWFAILFLEAGEYVHPDPSKTIEQLGSKICRELARFDKRFAHLQMPTFQGALSPLSDFLDDVAAVAPDLRIMMILDEFDNVPVELYKRGPAGEAFFSTIRSLSHKQNLGFILVGGERMRYLFDCQGQALNKFQMIRVDYFDKQKHWSDFQDLVTRPTKSWLQFSDSSLVRLYSAAAGNPYYTVLICRTLANIMVARRDSHVTEREAEEAVVATLQDASIVNFQHFWDDAIVETGVQAEEISMRRRFVLLSLAEALGNKQSATREEIAAVGQRYGLDSRTTSNELSEFIQRDVLVDENGAICCKVPLFSRWLQTVGPRQISTTYTEAEALKIYLEEEEKISVKSSELVKLVQGWPAYKGRTTGADEVRTWLEQFGRKSDQRLMFRALQHLTFYSEDGIRQKMNVVHGIVTRGLVDRRGLKQVKRWPDVLVSYLDGPGRSGARFAALYVDENGMYQDSLVERGRLKRVLTDKVSIQALVFIDDFVGTGNSACEYIRSFVAECGDLVQAKGIKTWFIGVCGFETGKKKLENLVEEQNASIRIHLCDSFDDSYVCFGPNSRVYPDANERNRARDIAEAKGKLLCRSAPLGYSDSQALIVFAHNCPNNTLPILWEKRGEWIPLFRRD